MNVFSRVSCRIDAASSRPFAVSGTQRVELPDFDVAPEPLVGLVADAEIIDREPVLAGFLDIVEEQELARAGMGEVIVADCPEFADQAIAAAAGAGDGANLAARLRARAA